MFRSIVFPCSYNTVVLRRDSVLFYIDFPQHVSNDDDRTKSSMVHHVSTLAFHAVIYKIVVMTLNIGFHARHCSECDNIDRQTDRQTDRQETLLRSFSQ